LCAVLTSHVMRTVAVLAFATTVSAQVGNIPADVKGVNEKFDIVYQVHGSRELRLDLYLPKAGKSPVPAVIYIHGGTEHNKPAFSRQARYMATRGFAGVCIEYTMPSEGMASVAVDDALSAVRWVRNHAAEYHIDARRIGVAGGSLGGYAAASLGVMPQRLVKAVAAFNPSVDIVRLATESQSSTIQNIWEMYFGVRYSENPKLWADSSPINHVTKDSAPFLFLHGDADPAVPYSGSVDMAERLRAAGVPGELFTAPGAKHGFFNNPPWLDPTTKRMEEFFTKYLT
jgi:acetyl esterase/lipase